MNLTFGKIALAAAALAIWTLPASTGKQKPNPENIWISATCQEEIEKKIVLISLISEGKIVAQREHAIPFSSLLISKVPGAYTVKMEGAGVKTQTKGPYQLVGGEKLEVTFALEPGPGATVVQYADGPMSREEIASRLKKLEDAVAKLQKGGG